VRRNIATLACGALALALGASAEEQGHVLGVRARGDDRVSSIEIEGDRPLSFTTMKLLSPPRVVVDFADAAIDAELRELEIEDGTLRRAAIAQAGARTARVVIELAVDAEFDVRADGNRVEVRIPRSGAIAAAPGDGPADAEAEKVASLPTVSLVGSKPAQPPDGARAKAAAEKAEALKKVLAEQRRRAAEEKAARKLLHKTGRKVAEKEPAIGEKEPSPPPAPTSASVASNAESGAPKRAVDAAPPRVVGSEPQPAVDARAAVTAEEPAPVAPPPARVAHGHRITGIGFRPVRGGEVIVRSDQPLEYGVSEGGDAVLLHLPSAAIPLPNNRRPLDTRFFSGAVQRVVPIAVPGGTDVRIELRERAEYQLAQNGSILTVTFSAAQ
jgi:hypothetical protein